MSKELVVDARRCHRDAGVNVPCLGLGVPGEMSWENVGLEKDVTASSDREWGVGRGGLENEAGLRTFKGAGRERQVTGQRP